MNSACGYFFVISDLLAKIKPSVEAAGLTCCCIPPVSAENSLDEVVLKPFLNIFLGVAMAGGRWPGLWAAEIQPTQRIVGKKPRRFAQRRLEEWAAGKEEEPAQRGPAKPERPEARHSEAALTQAEVRGRDQDEKYVYAQVHKSPADALRWRSISGKVLTIEVWILNDHKMLYCEIEVWRLERERDLSEIIETNMNHSNLHWLWLHRINLITLVVSVDTAGLCTHLEITLIICTVPAPDDCHV